MNAIALKKTLVQLQIKETVLVLALSVAFPFLIHVIPVFNGVPVGARLIPMFYAPFIAIILFRPHIGIVTGLLSPTLNSLLTGHPLPERLAILTLELVMFSIIAYFIHRKWRNFWGTAPVAYVATVSCTACILKAPTFLVNTIITTFPGIMMLLLINVFLRKFQPKYNNE